MKGVVAVFLKEARLLSEASPGAREMASEASTGRPAQAASLTGINLERRTPTGSVRGQ